jgi:DNA-binding beta-propeller fold protein YncE
MTALESAEFDREGRMRQQFRVAVTLGILFGLLACASVEQVPEQKATPKIVFPPAPSPPVIEWVAEYRTIVGQDEKGERLKRKLVGEKKRIDILGAPTELALSPTDEIFVVDQNTGGSIVILNRSTGLGLRWPGHGAGMLRNPIAVAIADDGVFYVSDSEAKAVHKYSRDRRFLATFGFGGMFEKPTAIAVSADGGKIAVCDTGLHHVLILDTATGELLFDLGSEKGSGKAPGSFHYPVSVAFDEDGYFYVADLFNFRIQIFDPDGELDSHFGQGGTKVGELYRPRSVTVDSKAEVIYVTDSMMNIVQMFNLDGEMLMFFAAPGKGPATLHQPTGIARRGDLLAVADTLNSRVQIFRFLGVPESDG